MSNWKFIDKKRVTDLSDYEENLSTNGGRYAYHTDRYFFEKDGKYAELTLHRTSAEFYYCEISANFTPTILCDCLDAPISAWISRPYLDYNHKIGAYVDCFFLEDFAIIVTKEEVEIALQYPLETVSEHK